MTNIDFLIVGAGIAGLTLASYLEKEQQSFMIMDTLLPGASSELSSGLINPVTGRRLVLTWNFEILKNEFLKFYNELEQQHGHSFISESQILQILEFAEDQNQWLSRTADEYYKKYFNTINQTIPDCFVIEKDSIAGIIQSVYIIQVESFLTILQKHFIKADKMIRQKFEFDKFNANIFPFQTGSYQINKAIIFTEGYRIIENPYFNWLPMIPLKGECLVVHIPGLNNNMVFKSDYTMVPMGNDYYWIGSNFLLNDLDIKPSESEKMNQLNFIKRSIKLEFNLIQHRCGIRPSIRDRRPVLGPHPAHSQLIVFNGLGTKGLSLAAYCSKVLTEFLVHSKPIDKELDLNRFISRFYTT
jgi:glycine/D-amino acid oxidase-like deaminating enzyme